MKYWAYVNNEILGPFEKEQLRELPAFSPSLLVCPQTPVGEKTEDWKEVTAYPELSAPAQQAAPSPAPQPASSPEPAAQNFPQPAIEVTPLAFKPLGGAKAVEPVPPSSHAVGMADIAVSHFGTEPRPAAAPAPESPAQASSGFDPISLSQIARRGETISSQEQARPAENLQLEPGVNLQEPPAGTAPLPGGISLEGAQQPAAEPAPARQQAEPVTPAEAPAQQPAQAASAPQAVTDLAGLENLIRRLDALSAKSATREDLESAVSPLRLKLDQMGEVVSSIKNSQFQHDVISKLGYLENSIGEVKEDVKRIMLQPAAQAYQPPAQAPARQEVKMESYSETVFGAQPAPEPKKEGPKPETPAPAQDAAKTAGAEIQDQGTKKKSNVGLAVKKLLKLVLSVVLLAAILLGAAIELRNMGIFDATRFLPFPLPFVAAEKPRTEPAAAAEQPAAGTAPVPAAPAVPAAEQAPGQQPAPGTQPQAQQPAAQAPQPQPQQAQPEAAPAAGPLQPQPQAVAEASREDIPEMIYITRTFKRNGRSLENYIYTAAARKGGDYNKTSWQAVPGENGKFLVSAAIPARTGTLTYAFLADKEKRTVEPANEAAKAVFAEMSRRSARRTPRRAPRSKEPRRSVRKPAAKPAAKTSSGSGGSDDDYEYVYVDQNGNEVPAGK